MIEIPLFSSNLDISGFSSSSLISKSILFSNKIKEKILKKFNLELERK
jgi:hypothetical protein